MSGSTPPKRTPQDIAVESSSGTGSKAPPSSTSSKPPSKQMLPAGTKLGKYHIKRLLGKGGMGAVYEAVDSILQRSVALKILSKAVSKDELVVKRFLREARSAAQLSHPNVVTVYEIDRRGSIFFIAMEFVKGPNGQDIIRAHGKVDFDEATRIIMDVCRALSAAHQVGLIHRDIKPENILQTPDGFVKLSDFGLAKSLEVVDTGLTQAGSVVGTPKYMSPEQCRNTPVDARSDIYALGGTYYTLLTGKAPYERETAMQMLYSHCSDPIPDPLDVVSDLPGIVTGIIQKMMAKNPVNRHQSVEEVIADLETAVRPKGGTNVGFVLSELEPDQASATGGENPLLNDTTRSGATQPNMKPAKAQPSKLDFCRFFRAIFR